MLISLIQQSWNRYANVQGGSRWLTSHLYASMFHLQKWVKKALESIVITLIETTQERLRSGYGLVDYNRYVINIYTGSLY